jgi:hypothetical protein
MNDTENNLPEAAELSQPALDQAQPEIGSDPTADQSDNTDGDTQGVDPEVFEEVEYEGKKYALPPELKDAILRQADYTRKTQELAQTRQQAEQTFAQQQARIEAERANIQAVARLTALDERLQQYAGVDWDSLSQSNGELAQREFMKYQQLKDSRQQFVAQIQQHEGQRAMQEQQETARQLQDANEALSREIKGWSPDYAQSLREVAKSLGAKEEQLNGIREPWIVKALHAQKVLAEMTKKAGAAAPAVAAKPVRTISGGNAKATVDPDKMSIEDWMRHEQRRTASARR